jgi:glutaminyl-peptide cyclotransferase
VLLNGLLAGSLVAAGCRPASAPPATASPVVVPDDLGRQALERIVRLAALGPRDSGTPGARQAAAWIAAELHGLGLAPTLDTFEDATPDGPRSFHNVLATLPGSSADGIILLSHFDTKAGIADDFIGANDGGSSTGLLLALAGWLVRQPRPLTLHFAFLDGEECRYRYGPRDGLHGSRRLARQMRQAGTPVRAVILLDMVGDQDLCFTVPRNSSRGLKLLLLEAVQAQGCRDRVTLLDSDILDDHQPFLEQEFPAINLIDFHYGTRPEANDLWHTPQDTLDKLSAVTLQQVGGVTLEMIHRLGAATMGSAQ